MNRLPQYYAIKQVDDTRWDAYIRHINSKRTEPSTYRWSGDTKGGYYGYDGRNTYGGTFCVCTRIEFQNNPTIITLDQFEEMTFELPEKWYVIRNEENATVLNEWNNRVHHPSNAYLFEQSVMYSDRKYSRFKESEKYTEITFKQFQDHVLAPVAEYVVKPVVPAFDINKWAVKVDTVEMRNEVAEWIEAQTTVDSNVKNALYYEHIQYLGWNGDSWSRYSNTMYNTDVPTKILITWAQFQQLKNQQ